MSLLDLIITAAVVACGLPLAYAVTRRLPLALLFTPVATALLASLAIVLMLVVGGGLRLWLVVVLVAQCAGTVWWIARRRTTTTTTPLPHGGWWDAAWFSAPLLPPFLLTMGPPEQWDAHSIWWLHAAYFVEGPDVARQSMANPAFVFTHADYPPLASAPVAAVWAVIPGYDFRIAQLTSALLAFSAIAMLMYAVRRVTAAAPTIVSRLAAVGVGLAVWSTDPTSVGTGMSDPVWAAVFAAGAALLLIGDQPFTRPALPLLLVGAAALTKNEGLIAVALLTGLVVLRERRNLRRAWPIVLPFVAGFAWTLVVRHIGAANDLLVGGRFNLLDPAVTSRLRPTLSALDNVAGTVTALAAAIAVLGVVFLRQRRRDLALGSDLWLWMLFVGYTGSLVFSYLISPYDVTWHLATSIRRVTLPLILLPCVSMVCWVVAAVATRPERASTPTPDPATPVPVIVSQRKPSPAPSKGLP